MRANEIKGNACFFFYGDPVRKASRYGYHFDEHNQVIQYGTPECMYHQYIKLTNYGNDIYYVCYGSVEVYDNGTQQRISHGVTTYRDLSHAMREINTMCGKDALRVIYTIKECEMEWETFKLATPVVTRTISK